MYRVIHAFVDLKNHHAYSVGDAFPRDGVSATPERVAELSANKNKMGIPLIVEVESVQTEATTEAPKRGRRKRETEE